MRALVIAAIVMHAAPAAAQAPSSPASLFGAGMSAYRAGDYATAAAAFEEAFRLDPRAEVAFTLAQAHRNQYFVDHDVTHLHRALGLYRHYLLEAPTGRRAPHARLHLSTVEAILAAMPSAAPPPPHGAAPPVPTQLLVTANAPGARAAIDDGAFAPVPRLAEVAAGTHRVRIEAAGYDAVEMAALAVDERLVVVPAFMRAKPARLIVRTARGASITVDGRAAERTTTVAPGAHRVAVTARGRGAQVRDVEISAGTDHVVEVALQPTPQRRVATLTLYGAGVLGGGALVASSIALLAQYQATSIPSPPARTAADLDRYRAAVDRRDRWRGVAIGVGTAALVTAGAGLALWIFDEQPATEAGPTLLPAVGPEAVGAVVGGTF